MTYKMHDASLLERLTAVLFQRCPRCFKGPIFKSALTIHEHCPSCGLKFAREPGYFFGAMYASYFLSIFILVAFVLVVWALAPQWPLEWILVTAIVPFVLLAPVMYRYGRAIWLHVDWFIDRETPPM